MNEFGLFKKIMESNFRNLSVKKLDKMMPSIDQMAQDSIDSQKKIFSKGERDIQFSDFSKDLDALEIKNPEPKSKTNQKLFV